VRHVDNLLATLVAHAAAPKAIEEDAVTEIWAWLLRHDSTAWLALRELLVARPCFAASRLPHAPAQFRTQVTVPHPRNGECRYDLVLDWFTPRLRVVLEAKVQAGLTFHDGHDEGGTAVPPAHQVDRYLDVAALATEGTAFVLTISRGRLAVGAAAETHHCFAGQLTWQRLHDVWMARLRDRAGTDATSSLAHQFLSLLEVRNMATPTITFDDLVAVQKYARFRDWVLSVVTEARDGLAQGGAFKEFVAPNERGWQEDHGRIGYRIWRSVGDDSFAFLGAWHAEPCIHAGVPDLYFFLSTRRDGPAQKQLDDRAPEIRAAIELLATRDPYAIWGYDPGGWETVWAVRSFANVLAETDPRAAAVDFYRCCWESAQDSGLLSMFVAATTKG
jgi:hypothetical protein